MALRLISGLMAVSALAACETPDVGVAAGTPVYGPIETRLLDGDLVGFRVSMEGATQARDVEKYAECAAAQYALIRGYGFARHVRTLVEVSSGNWRADAVYTISAALPPGERTIDAEVTVADCGLSGIPTV
ncbi:hypothetical protein [Flavimaricola marinus]|uniref:Lipoprotein n=1 Tax=Flavimaricola marinus TaxID=1819565 RepID=A0A238LFR8_9RHOB|nr:hypothetical protein LOM8899_01936 [Flavimaricola marinus]